MNDATWIDDSEVATVVEASQADFVAGHWGHLVDAGAMRIADVDRARIGIEGEPSQGVADPQSPVAKGLIVEEFGELPVATVLTKPHLSAEAAVEAAAQPGLALGGGELCVFRNDVVDGLWVDFD